MSSLQGEGESPATLVPQRTIGEEELFFWVQVLPAEIRVHRNHSDWFQPVP